MQLPDSPKLNIGSLSRLFSNTSECYKLFWFQAIMTKLDEGKTRFTFDEIVNEMIADAWYMVTEYHLNLGPRDSLEAVVNHIYKTAAFKPSEDKKVLINYLESCDDSEVVRMKRILILNVPYRLQAPFMPNVKGKAWDVAPARLADEINRQDHLLYYFIFINGLKSEFELADEWIIYLKTNKEIVRGWIQYCMIEYLQRRNPNVPGIVDKLYPPRERDLSRIIKYWKLVMSINPISEIYGNTVLTEQNISIDHFIPWSYVAHDEFWNLHPTTKSINSSKSNSLPDWDSYFTPFAKQEYLSYQMLWKYDRVHDAFNKCAKKHLNTDAEFRLFVKDRSEQEFTGMLKDLIYPAYESAKTSGFITWIYDDKQKSAYEHNNRLLQQ